MSTVKILHTGDFHIGSSRTGISHGKAEIKNTFFRVLDLCKSQSIDFLLIAGDLFDTPFPDSDTVQEIITAMMQIPDTIIAISPGNHDCACPGSVWLKYEFPENVYVFTGFGEYRVFPEKNVRLYGAAFTDRYERLPLLSTFGAVTSDNINICVLHGDLVSATSDSNYNPITNEAIKNSGFDYLALGHIHKRSQVERLGNTNFAYCGCPDGRGFDEEGSCGVYITELSKDKCFASYTEVCSRRYIAESFDVTGAATSAEIANNLYEHIESTYPNHQHNLYRINLVGTVNTDFTPNTSQIQSALRDRLAYIRVTDRTDTDFSDVERIAKESTLRGMFTERLLEISKSALPEETELYREAMKLGLKAFEKEITLNDN